MEILALLVLLLYYLFKIKIALGKSFVHARNQFHKGVILVSLIDIHTLTHLDLSAYLCFYLVSHKNITRLYNMIFTIR